jgi:hypothetical protein
MAVAGTELYPERDDALGLGGSVLLSPPLLCGVQPVAGQMSFSLEAGASHVFLVVTIHICDPYFILDWRVRGRLLQVTRHICVSV